VWAATIVVANVLAKNPFQVGFAHWNQEVEALARDGPDEPFAIRVRFGRPDGRFQDAHTEPLQFGVEVATLLSVAAALEAYSSIMDAPHE
jgi:hypothetical protein